MRTRPRLIYGLDDRPPAGAAIVLALQHALTMFGATVAVPLLLGPMMGATIAEIGTMISAVMICSGIATLLQVTLGSRLPIIQGISFSFLPAFFLIAQRGQAEGWPTATVMQYVAGAILVGAAIEIGVGFSGLIGWLRRVLSPVVVGPVIMLIGLSLFQHGAPKAGTHVPIAGLTIVLVIVFSLVLSRRSRFFRIFPILSAVVLACGTAWVLTVTGAIAPTSKAAVHFDHVAQSSWLRIDPREVVFPWGAPKFALPFVLAVLAGYLASMIESFGDYHACSHMAGAGDPTPRQISRGIGCEGIGCAITGVLGGFASTSYSENIGLVGLTKVASRRVVQITAVLLLVLGVFGKFGAVAAAIPEPIVGGLYCALFGLIAAVGVQQLARADLSSDRTLFIAGFSLFMGLSVPAYFNGGTGYAPGPEGLLAWVTALHPTVGPGLAGIVEAVGKTGMAVAALIGIVLDNLVPGSDAERGLDG